MKEYKFSNYSYKFISFHIYQYIDSTNIILLKWQII
jgi:hypothetical protein